MKKETPNHKPNFLLRKRAKTHLQQRRISNFSGGGPPTYKLQGRRGLASRGAGREGRGGEREVRGGHEEI